jgi:ABC-type nitrate/sulfonate/bicarbonate transport system substrate-binding protein
MSSMRRTGTAVLVFASMFAASACGGGATTAPSTVTPAGSQTAASAGALPAKLPLELATVQLWGSRDPQSMAEVVIADKKGYFSDEGLTVETKFVSFGSEIPPAVAGGSIVLGKQAGGGVILMAQTTQVRVFVRTSDISGGIGVVVQPTANIKTINDLEGKKLGMPKTTPNTNGVKKLMAAYGADYAKITIANMQPADAVTAFQKGDIDAAFVPETALSKIRESGGILLHTGQVSWLDGTPKPKAFGYYNPDVLFATKEFADKNPNTILALMRAMKRGVEYIKSNPDDAAQIVAGPMNSSPEVMKTAWTEFGFTFDFIDSTLATPMDELSQVLLDAGDNKAAPLFKDYSDPSFLRKLDPAAVQTTIQ